MYSHSSDRLPMLSDTPADQMIMPPLPCVTLASLTTVLTPPWTPPYIMYSSLACVALPSLPHSSLYTRWSQVPLLISCAPLLFFLALCLLLCSLTLSYISRHGSDCFLFQQMCVQLVTASSRDSATRCSRPTPPLTSLQLKGCESCIPFPIDWFSSVTQKYFLLFHVHHQILIIKLINKIGNRPFNSFIFIVRKYSLSQ